MQDVHWPAGLFGYFPSYTLGALISAQLYSKATSKLTTIENDLSKGDFNALQNWLSNTIHQQGSLLSFNDLMTQCTGAKLSAEYFLMHVDSRYSITSTNNA